MSCLDEVQAWHYRRRNDIIVMSLLSPPPFSDFPHSLIIIKGNLPVGWLSNWNICQKEQNSKHEANYSEENEALRTNFKMKLYHMIKRHFVTPVYLLFIYYSYAEIFIN